MEHLVSFVKLAWPFVTEVFKTKPELGRYVLSRKIFFYILTATVLMFSGMVYMSQQAVQQRTIADHQAAEIAELKRQVIALQQDNEALKMAIQAALIGDRDTLITALSKRTNVTVTASPKRK